MPHQPIYINNVKALQIAARMSGGVGIFATYLQTYYISYNPYKEWNDGILSPTQSR